MEATPYPETQGIHQWKPVWEDRTGAMHECERCGVCHQMMFIGLDVISVDPVPDHRCFPKRDAAKASD